MQHNLIIDIDGNIHDPIASNQPGLVAEVFRLAREALSAGKTVTIERRIMNAPPECKAVFTALDEFNAYVERFNDIQRKLGAPTIE
ncbi:hypothetical protein [Aromatoleum evansii]|uniref:hypothetical protein n=1 Tax=Aromatoleum evansii TaxID=59406 RepID=UPI00145EF9D3|nr:hypothetical protein [Aromatoleum evansii]NMG30579.1 hypothetical protein [Aromatoleum evansii]